MNTEYKFYMIAQRQGCSYGDRYDSYKKACDDARALANSEHEAIYVLEAVWLCEPKHVLEEQLITEYEPVAEDQ